MKCYNIGWQITLYGLKGFILFMDTLWPDHKQIDLNNQLVDAVIRRDYARATSLMQAGASPDNARFDGKNCFAHAKGDRRMENILLNKLDKGHAHRATA